MLENNFSIKNFQDWEFHGAVTNDHRMVLSGVKEDKSEIQMDSIRFIWGETTKKSKTKPEKTLMRELYKLYTNSDRYGFEAVKVPDVGIFIVFDKYQVQADSLGGGLFLGVIGLGLMAGGAPAVAASVVFSAGMGVFLDAYTKDAVHFDKDENTKQGLISAATGLVTGAFMWLKPLANLGSNVGVKAVEAGIGNAIGYATASKLQGESITLSKCTIAVLTGAIAPIAGAGAQRYLPVDKIDDAATALLLQRSGSGVAAAGASKLTQNYFEGKEWKNGLSTAMTLGALTSAASSVPEYDALKNAQIQHPNTQQPVGQTSPEMPTGPSLEQLAVELDSLMQQRQARVEERRNVASSEFGENIARRMRQSFKFDAGEKAPTKDIPYHKEQLLDRIASTNGQTVTFYKDGRDPHVYGLKSDPTLLKIDNQIAVKQQLIASYKPVPAGQPLPTASPQQPASPRLQSASSLQQTNGNNSHTAREERVILALPSEESESEDEVQQLLIPVKTLETRIEEQEARNQEVINRYIYGL